MFSNDEYLPVPTMRRDLNSLPPSQSDVSYMAPSLASAHRADDLDLVAVAQNGLRVGRLGGHLAVYRHRGELTLDAEVGEKPVDGDPIRQLHRLAVDDDGHEKTAPGWVRSG